MSVLHGAGLQTLCKLTGKVAQMLTCHQGKSGCVLCCNGLPSSHLGGSGSEVGGLVLKVGSTVCFSYSAASDSCTDMHVMTYQPAFLTTCVIATATLRCACAWSSTRSQYLYAQIDSKSC